MSAHKVYGPKGVGALYINKDSVGRVKALIVGGGQERGMRSGTLPTHRIAGMGIAYRISKQKMTQDLEHIKECRDWGLDIRDVPDSSTLQELYPWAWPLFFKPTRANVPMSLDLE